MTRVEICVETVQGVSAARDGGADRLELCSSLYVGGLTPSAGLMRLAAESGVPSRALIRPRGGSFCYDPDEIRQIEHDMAAARDFGLAGVVIGAARADRSLDRDGLRRLVDRRGSLGLTLHRVFDMTPDPFESLELAIDIGFDRILTSGQAPTAVDGARLIARLVAAGAGHITIVAAAGITPGNVSTLLRATNAPEVHASCRAPAPSADDPEFERFGFGSPPRMTDTDTVARLVAAAKEI